jgi:hypothetical protein
VRVAGHGISIDLPAGWEARIFRREGGGPVLHAATFALRDGDGDFGVAATGRMRADDMFAALIQYRVEHPIEPGKGLFEATRLPVAPKAHEFDPMQLQVTRRGQLGRQRFFSHADVPYCLYLVIQPARHRLDRLAGELGTVLATLQLAGPASPAGP